VAVLTGTPGNDTLHGTNLSDVIWLLAGNDLSDGRGGNDTIRGDRGNDTLRGGAGDDLVAGQQGNDDVNGGAGNDSLKGDLGNDTVRGDSGNDTIRGGEGDDLLAGQSGDDNVLGEGGNDIVKGDLGNDTLDGGAGNDTIEDSGGTTSDVHGSIGNDTISVSMEIISGETHDLSLIIDIHGDADDDTITSNPRAINTYENASGDAVGDVHITQWIRGGSGDDRIVAEPHAFTGDDRYSRMDMRTDVTVFGDDGDDHITVNPTGDYFVYVTVNGGTGDDTIENEVSSSIAETKIDGGDGDDEALISGTPFSFTLEFRGGDGEDTCDVILDGYGFEGYTHQTVVLFGDADDDVLGADCTLGNNSYNTVVHITAFGGSGNDTIDASASASGDPNNTTPGTEARNELNGGSGDDQITAVAKIIDRPGSLGFTPSIAANFISGGDGNDTIVGEIAADSDSGSSRLSGGDGEDHVTAIGGEDNVLDGDRGNDVLTGSANADTFVLRVGRGTDTVTNFQDGEDLFGLEVGLDFGDLTIADGAAGAEISAGAEILAIAEGILAADLTSDDFTVV